MYDDFVNNQQEIRDRLGVYFIKSGLGLTETAIKIGIAHTTITKFFSKRRNLRLLQLCKVIKFLEENQ